MEQTYEQRGYLHEDWRLFHLSGAVPEPLDWHYHTFHKLIVFLGGQAGYGVEGRSYPLEAGDVVLVPKGCIHRPELTPGAAYERVIVYISPEFLRRRSTADCDLECCFTRARERFEFVLRPRGGRTELARLLGITDRRVRQLADEEILTREAEGDYLLPEVIAEYYAYKYKTDESVDLMKEKALHEKAKRELAEIQLAQKRREMHDAADVEAVLTEILVNFRNQIRGIPSKMAPLLFGKSKPEIEELLSMEVEGRLEEIRDYTPTMFDAVDEKEGD